MTAQLPPMDSGPEMRDMDDVDATRRDIMGNVMEAVRTKYPVENDRYRLEVGDLRWDSDKPFSLKDQKQAIMRQKTLQRKLQGTWRLVDKANNQVVDQVNSVVAHVPYMTQRGTMIFNGSEYAVAGQMRLRSGVYTRRKDNGELEAHFNMLPGKGKAFRIHLEPQTGVFKLHVGQGSVPLYPVRRAQGVTDEQMEQWWGKDLLKQNRDQREAGVMAKMRDRFVGTRKEGDTDTDDQAVAKYFANMQLDDDVVKRSLGRYIEPELLRQDQAASEAKSAARSKRPEVRLTDFDREFFDTIPNNQRVHPPGQGNAIVYRTIMANGEKAGVIGVIRMKNDSGLIQDALIPAWQRKGVMRPALKLFCREMGLRKVLATVKKTNLQSRLAHEGLGFKLFPDDAMRRMRKSGWLPSDAVRYWLSVPAEWRK